MRAAQDFNYKVALADGLKLLQAKKLREAEERFRFLAERFPRADGGYRGLTRVQLELGDRAAALATLRDGAAYLARAGDRALAIELLKDAVSLDPVDLISHRRLAAALANAGDVAGAAGEHIRFSDAELAAGSRDRARLEAMYALETLGDVPELEVLKSKFDLVSQPQQVAQAAPASAPELASAAPAAPAAAAPAAARPSPVAPHAVPQIAEARALAAAGKLHAASDLLLDCVASGVAVHDAESELVAIARAMGREDLAAERARLIELAEQLG